MTPREAPDTAFHDKWLTSEGAALLSLVAPITAKVEETLGRSDRATRRDITARRRVIVDNVVANLATHLMSPLHDPSAEIAIELGQGLEGPARYQRHDWPQRPLASVLAALERCDVVRVTPYVFKERRTCIAPTAAFWEALERSGAGLADVGRANGEETILLAARTGERALPGQPMVKELVDYRDTEETDRFRSELAGISDFLNDADIRLDGLRQGQVRLRRVFLLRDRGDRPRFDLNGRVVGAWWQNLKRPRRAGVTIGGEGVVELDFSSAFLRLAYCRAGVPAPAGDLYIVDGLEAHRDAVKDASLSLLSRAKPMLRLAPDLKAALPDGWTAAQVTEAIARRHPAIASMFGSDVGVELMRQESEIMVRLTLALAGRSIPVLGIHDGVLAPAGCAGEVTEAMLRASHEVLGHELPVSEKPMRIAA